MARVTILARRTSVPQQITQKMQAMGSIASCCGQTPGLHLIRYVRVPRARAKPSAHDKALGPPPARVNEPPVN